MTEGGHRREPWLIGFGDSLKLESTMSSHLLIALVLVPTAAVVVAMFVVMWAARTTHATARAAIVAGIALAGWAVTVTVLGLRGAFVQPDSESIPPIGMVLLAEFIVMVVAFRASPSLRSLFTNQQHLIRLNVWRLEGVVFLLLMLDGQMPALWALPAGIGDIVVGGTAFWVARRLATPSGKRTAVMFHLWGLADLVVPRPSISWTASGRTSAAPHRFHRSSAR